VHTIAAAAYTSAAAAVAAGTLLDEHVQQWALLNVAGIEVEAAAQDAWDWFIGHGYVKALRPRTALAR
jgi:hypothetical protein